MTEVSLYLVFRVAQNTKEDQESKEAKKGMYCKKKKKRRKESVLLFVLWVEIISNEIMQRSCHVGSGKMLMSNPVQ